MKGKRYFYLQNMIKKRKEELKENFNQRYWGVDFDLGAEYVLDDRLQDLYRQLEECLEPRGYKKQWFRHDGIWKTLVELAEDSLVDYDILRSRVLYLGWPLEKAMFTPKIGGRKLSTDATTFLQMFFKKSNVYSD